MIAAVETGNLLSKFQRSEKVRRAVVASHIPVAQMPRLSVEASTGCADVRFRAVDTDSQLDMLLRMALITLDQYQYAVSFRNLYLLCRPSLTSRYGERVDNGGDDGVIGCTTWDKVQHTMRGLSQCARQVVQRVVLDDLEPTMHQWLQIDGALNELIAMSDATRDHCRALKRKAEKERDSQAGLK